jgi:hypothetical protein
MLEPRSVDQVLRVLELVRQQRRLGLNTRSACSRAIQEVADENDVRYQTIGDGCRRRLGLTDITKFHQLVDGWLQGNAEPLARVIRQSSSQSAWSRIDAFFSDSSMAGKNGEKHSSNAATTSAHSKAIQITLDDTELRRLHALAQLEARDPTDLAVELLSAGVRARLRAALG